MNLRLPFIVILISSLFVSCLKEEEEKQLLTYSVAYKAFCEDCDVSYRISNGGFKTVRVTDSFSSEFTDTVFLKSGSEATIYATSRNSASPEKVVIFSPGDTSVYYERGPKVSELKIGLSWLVYYPGDENQW